MANFKAIAKMIIDDGIEIVGVRSLCDDEQYHVGDNCRQSYDWDFEHDCSTYDIDGEDGRKAGGTCVTQIPVETDNVDELAAVIADIVNDNSGYLGARQSIIAGWGVNNDYTLDPGEIRIIDAYVLANLFEIND